MRLYTNCHNCRKEIKFSTSEPDRVELSKSKGEKIELNCNYCGQKDFYHVNKIKATESKTAQVTGLIIFIIGTPLTFYLIWDYTFRVAHIDAIVGLIGIIGVPFMVYSIINMEQKRKVRLFNMYKISESIK